jgi:hypothetical protein
VERCLACEAVVSKGLGVAYLISGSALCRLFMSAVPLSNRKVGGRSMGWRPLRPRKRGSAPRVANPTASQARYAPGVAALTNPITIAPDHEDPA